MKQLLLAVCLYAAHSVAFAANENVVFAGGCFWCMEPPFDKVDGVISTISGYSGGHTENPTYKSISSGTTGHYEVLKVEYDPAKVSYEELLNIFWKNIDPFDPIGQFCDKGPQYRAAVFFSNEEQKQLAQKTKSSMQDKLGDKANIVTQILPAKKFYAAEDYHQNYYLKNPVRYKYYRFACGRDNRLQQVNEIINGK